MLGQTIFDDKKIFGQQNSTKIIDYAYFMTDYPWLYLIMYPTDTTLHIQQPIIVRKAHVDFLRKGVQSKKLHKLCIDYS